MAADEASFSTSIEAMSCGLISCSPSSMTKLSTTTSGEPPELRAPLPRTRISGATPTSEVVFWIVTPDRRPCRTVVMSDEGTSMTSCGLNFVMAPVRCDLRCTP